MDIHLDYFVVPMSLIGIFLMFFNTTIMDFFSSDNLVGLEVTARCNGRLQRSARIEEGELNKHNKVKMPAEHVNTSASSLVLEEVEEGRRSLDLRSQYTTSPKSGWI